MPRVTNLIAIACLALGACGGGGGGSPGPRLVAVPTVVGLAQAAAATDVVNAGFVVGTVTNAASASVAAGAVISQDPAAGQMIAAGSSVNLVVSTGPPPGTVPAVVGLTQAAATSAITAAQLVVGITTQLSTTVAAGLVISQDPAPGASLAAGSTVNLVVSAIPVQVPSVVGLTQAAATTALSTLGLNLGTVGLLPSSTIAAGLILSQSPSAGTTVPQGSSVALVVSSGPPTTGVPNVVGLDQASATSSVVAAGLVVGSVTTHTSATDPAGSVISENPPAASVVVVGSAVSLVVSSGPPPVSVPNVVGQASIPATVALTTVGLTLGTVMHVSSATVPVGDVISENPAAGTVVAAGTAISLTLSSGPAQPNSMPIVVDGALNQNANILYTTITVCTPGTMNCQTIDHVQVDTGSTGLRIVSQALSGPTPSPVLDAVSRDPLRVCAQFVASYSWGSLATLDVSIGGRTLPNFAVQIIGDPAAGTAPSSCAVGVEVDTLASSNGNGLIGIGNFLQDCGDVCSFDALPGFYYTCPAQNCQPTTVALTDQLLNPIATLAADNNGVVLSLPSVAEPGAATVTGSLYFGVGTQADNQLGGAAWYALDPSGVLLTQFNNQSYAQSFVDSGSNAYFFDSTLTKCTTGKSAYYCPVSATTESATIQGQSVGGQLGPQSTVYFTVDNAAAVLALANLYAYPGLAGTFGSTVSFDWGLPFFFGRSVFVLFEQNGADTTVGPAVGF